MKRRSIIWVIALTGMCFLSPPLKPQQVRNLSAPESFQEKLESITTAYLDLEAQIRRGNATKARTQANALIVYLDEMSKAQLEGEKRADWMSSRLKLLKLLNEIDNAPDILDQRGVFNDLSHTLAETLKRFGPVRMNLYAFSCSDALRQGGYWIDSERSSVNPYDPDKPDCGDLREQIVSYKNQK